MPDMFASDKSGLLKGSSCTVILGEQTACLKIACFRGHKIIKTHHSLICGISKCLTCSTRSTKVNEEMIAV